MKLSYSRRCEGRESHLKGRLNTLGIGCGEFVLFRHRAVGPDRGVIVVGKPADFSNKAIAELDRCLGRKRGPRSTRTDLPVARPIWA